MALIDPERIYRACRAPGCSTTWIVQYFKKLGYPPSTAKRWLASQIALRRLCRVGNRIRVGDINTRERQVLRLLPLYPEWLGYWQLTQKLKWTTAQVFAALAILRKFGYARPNGKGSWSWTGKEP